MISFRVNGFRFNISLVLLAVLFVANHSRVYAQSEGLPYNELDLNSLDAFEAPSENWILADDVFMDVHERHDVQPASGAGILVNTNEGDNPRDIFTAWEHGDLDLELEFMMATESNSGIYFQGRYELQLLDSWGVQNPRFSDLGGVYEWWEDGVGVGGIPPRVNASRAPGLWQHLHVTFRAPRFNEDGEKIAHARLEEVVLNGVLIHRNVDLIHPTGGAISNEEVAEGPLRLQGDHGPVAFRNIRYKKYDRGPVQLRDLTYRYYEGEYEGASDVGASSPVSEGSREQLSVDIVQASDRFAFVYEGMLHVEEAGDYFFELRTDGGTARNPVVGGNILTIDGEVVIEGDIETRRWATDTGTISLSEGVYPLELAYYRGAGSNQPALSLQVEGPGIHMHPFHEKASFPVNYESIPLLVDPVREPMVLHGFMDMGERVHTHTAAVGTPGGTHFAFDQNNGSLLKIWKGDFASVSNMWVGRGGGNLALNEAATITFSGAPSLAYLNGEDAAWPDSLQNDVSYRLKSYRFDEEGHLTFNYQLDDVEIEDRIGPENESRELTRHLSFHSNDAHDNLYFRVAAGESISSTPNGLFQVDDTTYFIRLDDESKGQAQIRSMETGQELIIPVRGDHGSEITYSYIW